MYEEKIIDELFLGYIWKQGKKRYLLKAKIKDVCFLFLRGGREVPPVSMSRMRKYLK